MRAAPRPRSELLALARTAVNDLALAAQPAVISTSGKFEIRWDRGAVPGYPNPDGATVAARLFAALFPDKLFELLQNQIPDLPGVTATERAAREAELQRQILQLEHEEEALITQAEASGVSVQRRSDASAYALLSCMPPEMMQQQAAE